MFSPICGCFVLMYVCFNQKTAEVKYPLRNRSGKRIYSKEGEIEYRDKGDKDIKGKLGLKEEKNRKAEKEGAGTVGMTTNTKILLKSHMKTYYYLLKYMNM